MAARADKGERFASYGTLLEVRDAVVLEDGRFILSTVGVRRFRVREKGEEVSHLLRCFRLILCVSSNKYTYRNC